MKKIFLFIAFILVCVGLYIGMYFFYIPDVAESSFEQKRDSLEMSIKRQIKEAWNNNNAFLYFKEYGGANYLRMDMDAIRLIDNRIDSNNSLKNIFNRTNEKSRIDLACELFPYGRYDNNVSMAFKYLGPKNFEDLYEIYYIQSQPWIGSFIMPDDDIYNIKVFTYIPMFVGYKKETYSLREYRPSLDNCCKEAKEYIQEEDADNRMYYSPQNEERVNDLFNLRNDYYYFQFEEYDRTSIPHISPVEGFDFANFNFANHQRIPFPRGQVYWVYNNYYKVYYYVLRSGNMNLTFNDTKFYQEIESYIYSKRTLCNILLIICIGVFVLLLIVSYCKYKKAHDKKRATKESISNDQKIEDNSEIIRDASVVFERVINLSNPELFIKPYQPEKLDKANKIYSAALENKDNINVLAKLLEEAAKL